MGFSPFIRHIRKASVFSAINTSLFLIAFVGGCHNSRTQDRMALETKLRKNFNHGLDVWIKIHPEDRKQSELKREALVNELVLEELKQRGF